MAKKNNAMLSRTIAEVLRLATAIGNYWATELPRLHPDYPIIRPDDPVEMPPKEEKQLLALLSGQPDDFIYQLALIMYLGRGDFDVDDLVGQYEALKENFEGPDDVIAQMTGKASLADYLTQGIEELRTHGLDIDNLPLPATSQPPWTARHAPYRATSVIP